MPSESPNPLNDSAMLYRAGGMVETCTITTDLKTVVKYISNLRVYFKDALPDYMEVFSRYDGGSWQSLDNDSLSKIVDDLSVRKYLFTQTLDDEPDYGIKAYSIQFRFKLSTEDRTDTPIMLAWVMELLARIESKYAYTIPFVLEGTTLDPALDLLGVNDDRTAAVKLAKLIEWAAAGPLYMQSQDVRFHDKVVLLLPFAENLVEYRAVDGKVMYLGQLTLQDA
jgi:hypothetical protein